VERFGGDLLFNLAVLLPDHTFGSGRQGLGHIRLVLVIVPIFTFCNKHGGCKVGSGWQSHFCHGFDGCHPQIVQGCRMGSV
jgi:hypothetical protein